MLPPVASTRPSGSTVSVWKCRGRCIAPGVSALRVNPGGAFVYALLEKVLRSMISVTLFATAPESPPIPPDFITLPGRYITAEPPAMLL
jgi:hypothetical protein